MKEKIIITSGKKYIDIDAYGAMFAYQSLLKDEGYEVYVSTTAYLNESIPSLITDLNFRFDELPDSKNLNYIVLDVSHPDFIDTFVNHNNIIEIIDHHVGYEEYWNSLNIKNQIEFIGSVCTIIYEKIISSKKEYLLTKDICKILSSGILDNTLNLKSKNTTKRDIEAYNDLLLKGNLPSNWSHLYFESCYKEIKNDLINVIKNDTKIEDTNTMLPLVLGQLIVLDIKDITDNMDKVKQAFSEYQDWFFNIISLSDGKSYILTSNNKVLNNLLKLFPSTTKDNFIILDNFILRKEIIKKAKEYNE